MIDLQRPDRRHHLRHRIERNGLVIRRLHIELGQIGRIDAKLRLHFQNDLVVVRGHVDGAHLPRAVSVEKLVADLVGGHAIDRGLLAVDLDRELRILDVEIGGDVLQSIDLGDAVAHHRRRVVERVRIAALQRVLILALRRTSADVQVLDALEKGLKTRHLQRLLPEPRHHHGRGLTLLLRLQTDEQASVVRRRIGPAGPDRAVYKLDRGIGAQNIGKKLLPCAHRLE